MKAFISIDLEGLPHIVIPGQLNLKGTYYQEARKIATSIALNTIFELKENGFDNIIIADSHGPMVNLFIEDLPEYVEIVRGSLRPSSMVNGVEGCDVAIFLGYHAKFGTAKATFDHTYSSINIHQVKVNGLPISEYLLNAYSAGEYNVPVILVGGDAQLIVDDVKEYTPWVETVVFKQSISRIAARSPSLIKVAADLKQAIKKAVKKYKEKQVKLLKIGTNVHVEITFRSTVLADVAEYLPFIKRIDGLTIEFKAKNIIEAYNIIQLLAIVGSGINASLEQLG